MPAPTFTSVVINTQNRIDYVGGPEVNVIMISGTNLDPMNSGGLLLASLPASNSPLLLSNILVVSKRPTQVIALFSARYGPGSSAGSTQIRITVQNTDGTSGSPANLVATYPVPTVTASKAASAPAPDPDEPDGNP